jgi:hypothetical protein
MVYEQCRTEPSEQEDETRVDGFVATGEDVCWTSLEESQFFDYGLYLRGDLSATGASADDSYSFPCEIVIVSPF